MCLRSSVGEVLYTLVGYGKPNATITYGRGFINQKERMVMMVLMAQIVLEEEL